MARYLFRSSRVTSLRWSAGAMVMFIAAGAAEDNWSTDPSGYVWMRKDGQRITGNARLEKQLSVDKEACLDLLKESASVIPEKHGISMARGCLATKGYVLIPADEIEKRLIEAASASAKQRRPTERSGATSRPLQQASSDPNKANRQILAMPEKDRREFFATVILADARQCGDVTRAFYRGSARPSYNAIWDIGCSSGPNYSILIMSDEKGSSKIMTCGELRAIGGGECFVKP